MTAAGVPHVPHRYSYVVVKGYITDAENVWMETMEVDEAKQYCNANAKCKGFTFAGPDECAPPAAPSHRLNANPNPSPNPSLNPSPNPSPNPSLNPNPTHRTTPQAAGGRGDDHLQGGLQGDAWP
jgi:hypothetical protein